MYRRGNCVNVGGLDLPEIAGQLMWYIIRGESVHVPRHVRMPRLDLFMSVVEDRMRSKLHQINQCNAFGLRNRQAAHDVSPITSLVDYIRVSRCIQRRLQPAHTIFVVSQRQHKLVKQLYAPKTLRTAPNYAKARPTSAYWGPLNPGLSGACEKPNPGKLGATTWKLG